MTSPPPKVIELRAYGRHMRAGTQAQRVHDEIAQALKDCRPVCLDFTDVESVGDTFVDTLGALGARHGATVFRSIVFAHCSPGVETRIVSVLGEAGLLRGSLQFAASLQAAWGDFSTARPSARSR